MELLVIWDAIMFMWCHCDALNIAWWFSPKWHTMHTQTRTLEGNIRYAVCEFNIWPTHGINSRFSSFRILCSIVLCCSNDNLKCVLRFRLHSDTYTRHSVNHAFYKMGYALEQKRSRHQIIFVSIRDRRMWKLYYSWSFNYHDCFIPLECMAHVAWWPLFGQLFWYPTIWLNSLQLS